MIRAPCPALVCCLLLCLCGPAQSGSAGAREDAKKFVILTHERPVGYFEIPGQVFASKPPILFLSITRVVNPRRTPCEVLVYFAPRHSHGANEEKVRLGG